MSFSQNKKNPTSKIIQDLGISVLRSDHIFKGPKGQRELTDMSILEFSSREDRETVLHDFEKKCKYDKAVVGDLKADRAKTQLQLKRNANLRDACAKLKKDPRNKDKKVENLSFEGEGCAISLASVSILTDTIKGKDFITAKKITHEFLNMIKDKTNISIDSLNEDQKTTIMSLSGVKEFPMRVKCATMAWHTFISALEGNE